jgi:hypothetical protein
MENTSAILCDTFVAPLGSLGDNRGFVVERRRGWWSSYASNASTIGLQQTQPLLTPYNDNDERDLLNGKIHPHIYNRQRNLVQVRWEQDIESEQDIKLEVGREGQVGGGYEGGAGCQAGSACKDGGACLQCCRTTSTSDLPAMTLSSVGPLAAVSLESS